MIPVKLKLRNFMCYRNSMEPLSLNGFHIACLCGENGSGKSALLDAITWALWGEARAKTDGELVHQGESEMEVKFEFSLDEQLYRVIRKHARPQARRQGKTVLEFQMARGDSFVPLTADNLTKTQQMISELLRMDYRTFVNSSLLLQGRADLFTVNDPRERKEVLCRILGLSFYDELEQRAKTMVREQEFKGQEYAGAIKVMDMELVHRPEYEREIGQLTPALEALEGQCLISEGALSKVRLEQELLETKRQQLNELESQTKKTESEMTYWKAQVTAHRDNVGGFEKLIGRRAEIEDNRKRFLEIRQDCETLDEKLKQSLLLHQRRSELERNIERARSQILAEQRMCQSRIKDKETKITALAGLSLEIEQKQRQKAALDEAEETIRSQKEQSIKHLTDCNRLEAEKAQLFSELKGLKEKLALLKQEGARCPLCETDLGLDGRSKLISRLENESRAKALAEHSCLTGALQAKQLFEKLQKEIGQKEANLKKERQLLERRMAVLEKDISQASQAAEELPAEQARLVLLEQQLTQNTFADKEQHELHDINLKISGLGYSADRHRSKQMALKGLENIPLLVRQLEEAERGIDSERNSLKQAEERIQQSQQIFNDIVQRRQKLSVDLAAFPLILEKLKQAEKTFKETRERRQSCVDKLNAAKQSLQRCLELESDRQIKESLLKDTQREQEIYEELARAFGKKGIQALIIEAALPEIEAEANRLLGRMTDNRMHLKLESQRQTRQGNTIETLDILIGDEVGTRNYDMFSGGESFRINFALRIALAKLLARRAGAPLPTLVIDEGFGTQDNPGKEKLIEAINSVQEDFQKIIVITHLEELKDIFPVRINVEKTPQGSRVWMS